MCLAPSTHWMAEIGRLISVALNRKLVGWANYFCLGPVSPAYHLLDEHTRSRLRWWLCKKHKVANAGISRFPDQYLYEVLGLVHLAPRTHDFPWAKA